MDQSFYSKPTKIHSMRWLFSILLLLSALPGVAQNITIANLWGKDSRAIYIGIQNQLMLEGNTNTVTKINSPGGSIHRAGDTLTVYPVNKGAFVIEVETTAAKKSFTFEADYFPRFVIALTDSIYLNQAVVSKQAVLKSGALHIAGSKNSGDKLFDNFTLTRYALSIDGKHYQVNGKHFPKAVIETISNLESGSVISIDEILLYNTDTAQSLTLKGPRAFKIL